MFTRTLVVVAAIALSACSGSTPTQPTPPAAPLPAKLEMVPQALSFTTTEQGWKLGAQGQNTGTGCAATITGLLTVRDASETVTIASFPWNPSATLTVSPGSTFLVDVCCLSQPDYDRLSTGGTYVLVFKWFDVRCP